MYAAELGDYKTVEYLISKGVNPDSIDKVIVNNLDSKANKKIFYRSILFGLKGTLIFKEFSCPFCRISFINTLEAYY